MNKTKWDKEYATSFINEVTFLKSKGIRYTWVYTNEEGVSVWKFRKERKLWEALAEMYSDFRYEVQKFREYTSREIDYGGIEHE